MPLHQRVFWSINFFLIGVGLSSALPASVNRVMIAGLFAAIVMLYFGIFGSYAFSLLAVFLVVGAGYYVAYDARSQKSFTAPFDEPLALTVLVEKAVLQEKTQQVDAHLLPPYTGRIRITAQRYPELRYGDLIAISAKLEHVLPQAEAYFKKEKIGAIVRYPTALEILERDRGSQFKGFLFSMRRSVREHLERTLPPEPAALMDGLLLGKSSGISRELSEKLQKTGTTHLVALSGYNITIVATGIFFLLGSLRISRRASFYIALAALGAFVVMTGAEASVVRAALMASIFFLAEHTGRLYSVKNAIAVAAGAMVIANPYVLVFDVGFQLSFLALFGILFLKPALEHLLHISPKPGFLGWRSNLMTTVCAQLAVLPLLLSVFGFFPFFSILTNVLILTFTPITMGFGFLLVLASYVSPYLSFVIAMPTRLLLGYELSVINFFAQFDAGISVSVLPMALSVLYYAGIAALIMYARRKAAPAV